MKRKAAAFLLALTLTLITACSNQSIEVQPAAITAAPTTAAITDFSVTTTTAVAATTANLTVTTTAVTNPPVTTTSALATDDNEPKSAEEIYAPLCIENPDKSVMAQYEEFDYNQYPSDDKAAEEAAIAAYMGSDYYKEALEETRELLKYENGELTETDLNWKTYYGGIKAFVDKSKAPDIDIEPKILVKIKAKLDGENEENLFVFSAAMPDSCIISSAEKACIVFGIYVNSEGQAFILDDSLYQGDLDFFTVKYVNSGKIHGVFNGYHSDGTARTAVYSFQNGQPKLEMYSYGNLCNQYENGRLWKWAIACTYSIQAFYNENEEKYYYIQPDTTTD